MDQMTASTPTLSILVASSGRPTLARTIEAARSQMRDGDEILVSVNTDCPWGHKARNQMMRYARGDYLLFIDDDDMHAPGAFDAIRAAPKYDGDGNTLMHMFKMRYANGQVLWHRQAIECGNVSTQMVAVPSIAPLFAGCKWGDRYEGDFDFIAACAERLTCQWHEDVIALVRP